MPSAPEAAVLRTVAWFMIIGYPPLEEEVLQDLDIGSTKTTVSRVEAILAIESLANSRYLQKRVGRLVLPDFLPLVAERERRERFFPRKWARIQRLGRWLRWIPSIRFLAVCNTTALGAARDEADIDLFLIVRRDSLWLTRGFLLFFTTLLFRRPGQRHGERDAWCFSFLMDETDLGLERFVQAPADPYLRFWTRHLLPILDDGIGRSFWEAQAWAVARQPFARRWLAWKSLPDRSRPFPRLFAVLERWAFIFQRWYGPHALWGKVAGQTTDVVLTERVCKTHTDDRRTAFRLSYEALCQRLDITP